MVMSTISFQDANLGIPDGKYKIKNISYDSETNTNAIKFDNFEVNVNGINITDIGFTKGSSVTITKLVLPKDSFTMTLCKSTQKSGGNTSAVKPTSSGAAFGQTFSNSR